MRGATQLLREYRNAKKISIHAPRAGSDLVLIMVLATLLLFQSTLPVRGATRLNEPAKHRGSYFNPRSPCGERLLYAVNALIRSCDFNPRSPCGERPVCSQAGCSCVFISIHAPRAGSDIPRLNGCHPLFYFNPRSPCGERRRAFVPVDSVVDISIHAPRAGSDPSTSTVHQTSRYFNPRSPCGERRLTFHGLMHGAKSISIHAPRAGSDQV